LRQFVLDASVALAWFVDDPVPKYAAQVRVALESNARAVVPFLWHLEIANALVVAERRKMLTSDDAIASLIQLEQLLVTKIESVRDFISSRQALDAARRFQLSAYDAVYLQTALRQRLPLATLDKALQSAAGRAGVELFRN